MANSGTMCVKQEAILGDLFYQIPLAKTKARTLEGNKDLWTVEVESSFWHNFIKFLLDDDHAGVG